MFFLTFCSDPDLLNGTRSTHGSGMLDTQCACKKTNKRKKYFGESVPMFKIVLCCLTCFFKVPVMWSEKRRAMHLLRGASVVLVEISTASEYKVL